MPVWPCRLSCMWWHHVPRVPGAFDVFWCTVPASSQREQMILFQPCSPLKFLYHLNSEAFSLAWFQAAVCYSQNIFFLFPLSPCKLIQTFFTGIYVSLKNLKPPWNFFITHNTLYSGKRVFYYLNVLHTLNFFFSSNNCSLTSQKMVLLWHHLKLGLDDLKPKISISFNFSPSQKSHYPILENNILSLARKS